MVVEDQFDCQGCIYHGVCSNSKCIPPCFVNIYIYIIATFAGYNYYSYFYTDRTKCNKNEFIHDNMNDIEAAKQHLFKVTFNKFPDQLPNLLKKTTRGGKIALIYFHDRSGT